MERRLRYHGLDLNLLIALDGLLTTRSITQSGTRLHLSQPAMSCALGRLRQYFRDDLLVPSGRRMIPTPLAESLAPQLHDLILQIDSFMKTDRSFDPATSDRRFSVVASDNTASVILLEVQLRLHRLAPDVVLEIVPISDEALGKLKRGEVDLAILPNEYAVDECVRAPLYRDVFSCIVWTGNHRIGPRISLAEYAESDHVTLQAGAGSPPAFYDRLCNQHGIEIARQFLVPTFGLAALWVVQTDRVATVPSRIARLYTSYLPVREVEPEFEMPSLEEVMQWHPSLRNDNGLIWLRQQVAEVAQPGKQA